MASIRLRERLVLVVYFKRPKQHICVLWGIKRPVHSFSDLSIWDGNIVAFSRDVAEVMLPPTVLVKYTWWDLQEMPIVSTGEVYASLLGLSHTVMSIPMDTAASDQRKLPLAYLSPLNIMSPLLNTPFLSPAVNYDLAQARFAIIPITADI